MTGDLPHARKHGGWILIATILPQRPRQAGFISVNIVAHDSLMRMGIQFYHLAQHL
jgi:hypothetical protein